jgi:hypothetical protein
MNIQVQEYENKYKQELAFNLVMQEMQYLSGLIHLEDQTGHGLGKVKHGAVLNQATLLGFCNYLLHYDLQAVGKVQVAYLSHK